MATLALHSMLPAAILICFHGKTSFSLYVSNGLFYKCRENISVVLCCYQLVGLDLAHRALCDSWLTSCSLSLLGFHTRFLILDLHILLLSHEMILCVNRDHLYLN